MQARYGQLLAAGAGSADRGAGIAFVTVTHNSEPELRRLAASISAHLPEARLVVVDNASGDGSVTAARDAGATVIENRENAGFGSAANAGVAAVTEQLIAAVARDAAPGRLLAPLLLNPDGTRQDGAQPRPSSLATALYALAPGPLLPGPLRRFAEPWRARKPARVGWATAACLVGQTDTLRALGPFDESIFMYAEDLDLGLRTETWLRPDARVIHARAHSSERAFGGEPYELLARQRRAVVERRLGRARAMVDTLIQAVTFADRRALKRLARRPAERERAQLAALRAARRRVR
jgi:N-acetylglucosaminyl-diphospho-decaprenol L-rhamnosyltransferase